MCFVPRTSAVFPAGATGSMRGKTSIFLEVEVGGCRGQWGQRQRQAVEEVRMEGPLELRVGSVMDFTTSGGFRAQGAS